MDTENNKQVNNNETANTGDVQSVAEADNNSQSGGGAAAPGQPTKDGGSNAPGAVQGFLDNASNRQIAQQQAHRLWTMLVGTGDVSTAPQRIFRVTDVVHHTSLSHRTARELFNLLRAFNFFQWADAKAQTFRLIFDPRFAADAVRNDILAVVQGVVRVDIQRWVAALRALDGMTAEGVDEEYGKLRAIIDAAVALPAAQVPEPKRETAKPTSKKGKQPQANSQCDGGCGEKDKVE